MIKQMVVGDVIIRRMIRAANRLVRSRTISLGGNLMTENGKEKKRGGGRERDERERESGSGVWLRFS